MTSKNIYDQLKELRISEEQDINILLLGETGVGKSTFINSIVNYLHFHQFEKACKSKPLIVIPSVITVVDKKKKNRTIKVGSEDQNEYQEVGAAGTQDVKTYICTVGNGKTRLRFIDTPGMVDPRGVEQDDINCEYILQYLYQIKELHAICILLKPTNTRITVQFHYCLSQILSRLEKSANENIIFVFTNTRGVDYTSGDTWPCLKKFVEGIKAKPPHVTIPLKSNNVFNLDNEAFKYLLSIKQGIKYSKARRKQCKLSWENSYKECWRLIAYIVGDKKRNPLKSHELQGTISVNEARRLINQLSKPMAEIIELINDNIRALNKHKEILATDNQSIEELKKNLYIPAYDLKVIELDQPVTVCTNLQTCVRMITYGTLTKPHYYQRCHDPCYLKNVEKEIVGDSNLKGCAAMDRNGNCKECTCNYAQHQHVYYMSEMIEKKITDQVVLSSINTKESAVQQQEIYIEKIDEKIKELKAECDFISESAAEFAHFLQLNAISPVNNAYEDYINYLISREQSRGEAAEKQVIENYTKLLQSHNALKSLLKSSNNSAQTSPMNPDTVFNIIERLKELKNFGSKIYEMVMKQFKSRNKEYENNCKIFNSSFNADSAEKDDKESKEVNKKSKSKKKNRHEEDVDFVPAGPFFQPLFGNFPHPLNFPPFQYNQTDPRNVYTYSQPIPVQKLLDYHQISKEKLTQSNEEKGQESHPCNLAQKPQPKLGENKNSNTQPPIKPKPVDGSKNSLFGEPQQGHQEVPGHPSCYGPGPYGGIPPPGYGSWYQTQIYGPTPGYHNPYNQPENYPPYPVQNPQLLRLGENNNTKPTAELDPKNVNGIENLSKPGLFGEHHHIYQEISGHIRPSNLGYYGPGPYGGIPPPMHGSWHQPQNYGLPLGYYNYYGQPFQGYYAPFPYYNDRYLSRSKLRRKKSKHSKSHRSKKRSESSSSQSDSVDSDSSSDSNN